MFECQTGKLTIIGRFGGLAEIDGHRLSGLLSPHQRQSFYVIIYTKTLVMASVQIAGQVVVGYNCRV
ncbi:hypothetical protein CPter291_2112 [Collimonas pratensis]|uniref:Uncharacterized protein n=1 Tax=Collimonas pratensis TaxID=279113 RepID=A0ABN4M9B1_9BURK|nr:hypothetical protein CPter291_2112 [Collimonas pratensis]